MKTLRALLSTIRQLPSWLHCTLAVLRSINDHLEDISKTAKRLNECINSDNHQNRPNITTGHWNDNRRH